MLVFSFIYLNNIFISKQTCKAKPPQWLPNKEMESDKSNANILPTEDTTEIWKRHPKTHYLFVICRQDISIDSRIQTIDQKKNICLLTQLAREMTDWLRSMKKRNDGDENAWIYVESTLFFVVFQHSKTVCPITQ